MPKMFRVRDLERDFFSLAAFDSLESSLYLALCILPGLLAAGVHYAEDDESLPAVANHAHPFGLSLAVELGALLEILLAADALSIAEARLGKSVNVTPCYSGSQSTIRAGAGRQGVILQPAISKHRKARALSWSIPHPFMWLTPSS
jgi:hypothetical protein